MELRTVVLESENLRVGMERSPGFLNFHDDIMVTGVP
jgi:hypothetical protein